MSKQGLLTFFTLSSGRRWIHVHETFVANATELAGRPGNTFGILGTIVPVVLTGVFN